MSKTLDHYFKPKPKPKAADIPQTKPKPAEKPQTKSKPAEKSQAKDDPRAIRKKIAEQTLNALKRGSYTLNNVTHQLVSQLTKSEDSTRYYTPDSTLSLWNTQKPFTATDAPAQISLLEISTLEGARLLTSSQQGKIGVLNFASAKKPGGGFLSGAQAQEESIARSSTLYPTLMTDASQQFYTLHKKESRHGYYSHAIIYSPGVVVFRDDDGNWVAPYEIDVLTSPAVNAGVVHESLGKRHSKDTLNASIEKEMRERMARILFLFEKAGMKNLVLGSFGTGVFRNDIGMVATIWADLLSTRFKSSFTHIIFAILGRKTFEEFSDTFNERLK